jgi:glycosyltransferase involved in cell wall biosynthesis
MHENGGMSPDARPLISVVVAVKDCAATLERCIESVTAQTYPSVDLVIVDGASTDGSVELIKKHAARLGNWVSEPDTGIYDAWNKGLDRARGDWICFLGADDYFWDSRVVEKLAGAIAAAPAGIRVVYGSMVVVTASGKTVAIAGDPWQKMKRQFGDLPTLPHPGMMHKRDLFAERGKFDTSFRIAGDYELLLREFRDRDALFVPELLVAGLQQGGISGTRAGMRKSLLEVRRAQRLHGISWPGRRWIAAFGSMLARETLFSCLGERLARRVLDWGRVSVGKPRFWTAAE